MNRTSRGTLLLPFFLLTYAVMWVSFITVAAARIPADSPLGALLLRLGAYSPSLVAIWLTARAAGGAGVSDLLSGIFKWRVPARYYVLAIAFIPVVKLTAALLHRLTSGAWPRMGGESLLLIPLAIAFSTPFQAGEEIGWRGYALPRLADRFGLRAASLMLGLIWAVWHLPQFFIRDAAEFGQSFPLYVLQVTALGVVFAWLYARTNGSLLLVMLLHAATNNTKDIFPSATPGATNTLGLNASLLAWLTVALLWISAGYFLFSMPKWTPTAISSPSSSSSLA
ncbi:MAG: CPBP family intramembrane glutamic endopeptidase [Gemmatimonadaceae bacterium]